MDKIQSVNSLAQILQSEKEKGKKIVHCHGVFDLLHIGHIRYFEQARQMGDILIVTVTTDKYVDKGPHRPAFAEDLRAEAVASLNCVNYVAVNPWMTAEETLKLLKPDIYVKGAEFKEAFSDRTGKIDSEKQVVEEIGAKIAFTEDIVFSSTNLINRYLSKFPEEIDNYLTLFRKRFSVDDILKILNKMSELNVLVIGDAILDEYNYGNAIGKSSKDPTLAFKYESKDLFAGGVLAVANHVANFSSKVQLVTVLGENDTHEKFVRSQLQPNVFPYFAIQKNAPTTIKKRFIDGDSLSKLFEVYIMDDSELMDDTYLCKWLQDQIPQYDLVIVADFGHGAISNSMIDILCNHSKFIAVNTQANAGNRGFHTVSRYQRSDFICIAEHELRLEMRDVKSEVQILMQKLLKRMECQNLVVTCGRKGCVVCENNGQFVKIPSFAQNIIDAVGAGDAFLSVTSLAAVQNSHKEAIGFIGNIVGSLAVEQVGNKQPINRSSVEKYIVSLLK